MRCLGHGSLSAVISQRAPTRLVPVAAAPDPDHACLISPVTGLNTGDSPTDVIDALILSPFAEGLEPFARTTRIPSVRAGAALTPPGARADRVAADDQQESRLFTGDGWTLRTVIWRSGSAEVTVTARTEELAESMLSAMVADAAVEPSVVDGQVTIGFWHRVNLRGGSRSVRKVSAAPWTEIERNYSAAAADAMGRLMAVTPESFTGQLILRAVAAAAARRLR